MSDKFISHTYRGKWIKNLPLILLAGAISLSPSFDLFNIASTNILGSGHAVEIRVEDIILALILIGSFSWLLASKRHKIVKPPIFLPIILWISIGVISTLLNSISRDLSHLNSLLYLGKELEYFLIYFVVFYYIKDISSVRTVIISWVIFTIINLLWIVAQILTPFRLGYYYGPTLFAEPANPFGTGAVFLIISIYFISIFLYVISRSSISVYKKTLCGAALFSPLVGLFGSGSQLIGVTLLIMIITIFILYIVKSQNKKSIYITTLTILITITLFIGLLTIMGLDGPGRQIRVLDKIQNELIFDTSKTQGLSRVTIWYVYLENIFKSPYHILIGHGKGYFGETHNQFIRNLSETGIIGSILFFILIISILRNTLWSFLHSKNALAVSLSVALFISTISMLIISIATESFIYAVKISEVYWFFAGLTFAVINLQENKYNHNTKLYVKHSKNIYGDTK